MLLPTFYTRYTRSIYQTVSCAGNF